MNNKLSNFLKENINRFPKLKLFLIKLLDNYFVYKQILIGLSVRGFAYIKNLYQSKLIAKPGTLRFKGGIFNPGVIDDGENLILIATGRFLPWYYSKGKNIRYFLKGYPVYFILNRDTLEVISKRILYKKIDFPDELNWAIEDLRLFQWNRKIFINHSYINLHKTASSVNQSFVFSALSVFDSENLSVKFLGIPQVDFLIQKIEKNWVYLPVGKKLYLFYSINPYHILSLENEETLTFKTIIKQEFNNVLKDPGGFGTLVSLSVNPIEYDNDYWIIIIHQIDRKITGRCYYHWAVLIDKSTLLPVKITSKPIFSGMGARGRTPGIRYISSIIKKNENILFFTGEGDIYTTVLKKSIRELETLFVNL